MNILTLNCFGGHQFDALMQFVEKYKAQVDVWCLQEVSLGSEPKDDEGVRHNLLNEFLSRLPGFAVFTFPSPVNEFRGKALKYNTNVGLATLVRQGMNPKLAVRAALYDAKSEHATARPDRTGTGNMIAVKVSGKNGNELLIGNVHGLWTPLGKGDVPDRVDQSCRMASFAQEQGLSVILIGDFNMELNSLSSRILEEVPMRNLVKKYRIATTRTAHYDKSGLHADNAFVTAKVQVKDFKALPDIVSDHAALLLEVKL